MKKLTTINSINATPAATTRYSTREDGFVKLLNDAISTANQNNPKEAVVNQTRKEQREYSLSASDQSSISISQMNARVSAQTYLSASMLSLYKAQEAKNDKSGKSRAVAAASAI